LKFFGKTNLSFEDYKLFSRRLPLVSPDSCFFNLSSSLPSPPPFFINILRSGAKHVPQPQDVSNQILKVQLSKFLFSTRWAFFHDQNPQNESYDPKFYIPKNIAPTKKVLEHCKPLDEIFDKLKFLFNDYVNNYPCRTRNPDQLSILQRYIRDNPLHMFTITDKNLGFALLSTKEYVQLCNVHLLDSTTYKTVHSNAEDFKSTSIYQDLCTKYETLLDHVKLSKSHYSYLNYNWNFTLPKFHVLPKVHKEPPLKTRPIVGSLNWITTPFSKVLDAIIQPYLNSCKFILKNSQALISDLLPIQADLPQNTLLVSLDISSLYTNIDLRILSDLLSSMDPCLSEITNFVTSNNYFEFNNLVYHQTNGLAMGTNAAVNLANLYLGKLLDPFVSNSENVLFYRRYIDDLFLLWTGTHSELDAFRAYLNNLIPKIQFTMAVSTSSIEFLDLTLFKDNSSHLQWSTYFKPMSKFLYLTRNSCHPTHTIKGMIKGELLRYRRNSSQLSSFLVTKHAFYLRLLNRGYRESFILKIFKTVTWDLRESEATRSETSEKASVLPLILPFNKRRNFLQFTKKITPLLHDLASKFKNSRSFIAFTKSKNLERLLSKSSLTAAQRDSLQL
jgi:hypothetical protein